MKTKSEYDLQAKAWAEKYGVRMTATFAGHRKYFADDTDTRDVYRVTLTRTFPSPHPAEKGSPITRTMSFDFGASLNDSRRESTSDGPYWNRSARVNPNTAWYNYPNTKRVAPSLYDILSCIEKYDPGTHEDFCGSYGYDTDSRKVLETYLAVQKQWRDFVHLMGNNQEAIDAAREIQ